MNHACVLIMIMIGVLSRYVITNAKIINVRVYVCFFGLFKNFLVFFHITMRFFFLIIIKNNFLINDDLFD